MSEGTMSKALDAIHDEGLKLLQLSLPPDVRSGVELIVSIARYKHDVRARQERSSE